MKKSQDSRWAPVVYSMVVFPGLGQFKLGRKIRGTIFAVATLVCLIGFVVQFFSPFQHIIMSHIAPELYNDAQQAPSLLKIMARWLGLLFAVWLAAGIDAYIVGVWPGEMRHASDGKQPAFRPNPNAMGAGQPETKPEAKLPPPPTPGLKR